MVFDWAEYLTLAEELAMRHDDEAALRSAVSRAYYAAFCQARNRLRQEGVDIPKTGAAHRVVWSTYRGATEALRRQIGNAGDRLRRSRNKADYDDEVPRLATVVEDALAKAKRLVESLENLNHEEE
jgi:uncharacterized protein (UPF0332 family)